MYRRRRARVHLAAWGFVVLLGSALPAACALDVEGSYDPDAPCEVGAIAPCYSGPPGTRGVGRCIAGTHVCRLDGTFGVCAGEVLPVKEDCFTPEDEDCDGFGRDDPECRCEPGDVLACETGLAGVCSVGSRKCTSDGEGFGVCLPIAIPSPEDCASPLDEDCDGLAPACTGDVDLTASSGGALADVAFGVATNGLVHATAGVLDGDVNFRTVNAGKMYLDRRVASLGVTWSLEVTAAGGLGVSRGVAVAPSGDIIAAGDFSGAMNFGNGTVLTSAAGGFDAFVVSVKAAGEIRWAKAFGDANIQGANAVAAGPKGLIAVAGEAWGTIDFGGGPRTASAADAFVAVLAADGKHYWSRLFGDTALQRAYGVAFAPNGDVVIAGEFDGYMDLGGGVLLSAGGGDAFVARLSGSDGTPKWRAKLGDDAFVQRAYAVAVGPSGEIAVTGEFGGSITVSGTTITSASQQDAFLVVFEPGGELRFAKQLGDATGLDQVGSGVAFDAAGNVVVTGSFDGSIDFGAGPVASAGSVDMFVAKYAGADGALLWARTHGDAGAQRGFGIAAAEGSKMLVAGGFAGTLDFGPPSKPLVSQGGLDMFVVRAAP